MSADDEQLISRTGHDAYDQADALNRVVSRLHSTVVTRADLILDGLPAGISLTWHREKLAAMDVVLKANPAATFKMHDGPMGGELHELKVAIDHFRQAITSAEKYACDRRK